MIRKKLDLIMESAKQGLNVIFLCRLICQLMGEHKPENTQHEKLITFVKYHLSHDWHYAIDATKMNDELNWKPAETFETGIRKTVEWYLG